ncbi:condensation domain-containing protein [Microbispora sp. ZYX-F-249]|uniref:Condensation domain-containing protein n=1 Tax=Microbispora maris TaxID=3144104 RepID=A0ABV0AZB9_9ACTN
MSISEISPAPIDLTGDIPLSHTQSFLRLFDQGDDAGPFGPRYNLVVGWRIGGRIDVDVLRQALDDVAARHDVLRATIVRGDGPGHQHVAPPTPVRLVVRDLPPSEPGERDLLAEELLGEVEAGSYAVADLPHFSAVLGRFDDEDAVIALIAHHTASDGWSMHLLMRDVAARYAVRSGHPDVALPEARPYAEYATRQQESAGDPATDAARRYWRDKLRGARMLAIPTDHPRSAGLAKRNPVHRFTISAEVTSATTALAREMRCSPFMVLLAAYNVQLHRMTGATDLVVPTLASGRNQPEFHETVGPFFNFVPLRTDIDGCGTFREVVGRTRATCLEAMTHDLPFAQVLAEAPELMAPMAEDRLAACAFQVWQFPAVMERERVGDLEYTQVRKRVLSQEDGTDIPDGALITLDLDPSGEIFGNISHNTNLFADASMLDMVAEYRRVLERAVAGPDLPLSEI